MRNGFLVLLAMLATAPLCTAQTCDTCYCPCTPRSWFSAEYLYWYIEDGPSPPLATTGDPGDDVPGALNQRGTEVLFAGDDLEYGASSGARITFGQWLTPDGPWGWEFSSFGLATNHVYFDEASGADGAPALFVPIIVQDPGEPNFGEEGVFVIAQPLDGLRGGFSGNLNISSSTQLWGAEVNALRKWLRSVEMNIDFMLGFRHLGLEEDIVLAGLQYDFVADIRNDFSEQFATRNYFYGPQIGANVTFPMGDRIELELQGKVAVGVCEQTVDINGASTFSGTGFGPTQTFQGAILTQPTNIGRQQSRRLSVAPQFRVRFAYQLTPRLRAVAAYDILYWNRVARPGEQIDRDVNLSQTGGNAVTGAPLPRPLFQSTSLVAQGLSVGLELRY